MSTNTSAPNRYPVDSAIRPCCGGIGTHTRHCAAIPLPKGSTTGDDWENEDGRRYRVIAGRDRRVEGVDAVISTNAVQWDDGNIDLTKFDGPSVWIDLGSEGIPTAKARLLAREILAAADEADGWAR